MNKHADYLIIGGGIAGLMMAYQLEKNGLSFLLIDEGKNSSSSKVAAGMFNPISGKRMTVNWRADELLETLHASFVDFEKLLNKNYLVQADILQAFGNIKESNDFFVQLEKAQFNKYIALAPAKQDALNDEFGSFGVKGSGWVKTSEWIADYQAYLLKNNKLIYKTTNWDELKRKGEKWLWREKVFNKVVSCEGFQVNQNPYFDWLPFKLCKGQVLHILCKGLNPHIILKKGVYLVHQFEDVYKVGATYEWDFEDEHSNETGQEMLLQKLSKLLVLPFEVVNREAGIRPTTRDRAAILGEHPHLKNLYCFNGLGTKGMLQAPFLSAHLLAHIETKSELLKEVNIQRFKEFYTNSHPLETV
ncbi:MAG: NAD(P)/FAD-dependent oxidoreductase [Bacteroidia bacterium]